MSQNAPNTVEFMGGPFDGHVELLPTERGDLPEHVLCYVSENLFRQLHGQENVSRFTVTSVAIYMLLLHNGGWAYIFVKAVAPDSLVVESGQKKS
jgi:hypothetical protein